MKVTRHGQYLWKLTRWWVINTYLVQEEDGLTLVDTGMGGSGEEIVAAAEGIGQPIRRVMLTHAHMDHAGSLDELRTLLPEAEFVLGARTATFLAGETALRPGEKEVPLRGTFVQSEVEPDRLIESGEQVGSLQVIATPGHSPDHLAFRDERDGTIIAGDAFQTQGGVAVAGTLRWRFPIPAMATWDAEGALESATQLRALEPTRLAVGHGGLLESPLDAMDRAIAAASDG